MAKQKLFTDEMGKNIFVFPSNHSDTDVKKSVYSPKTYFPSTAYTRSLKKRALNVR